MTPSEMITPTINDEVGTRVYDGGAAEVYAGGGSVSATAIDGGEGYGGGSVVVVIGARSHP